MIQKRNSTQLLWHHNPKKCRSTSLKRRTLISYHLRERIAIKNPILRLEIDLPEKFGQMTRFTSQNFPAKGAIFGQN